MRIGDLTTQISFEAKCYAPDYMGGASHTWLPVSTGIWAAIWPLKASERVQAHSQEGVATKRVRLRFRKGIRASWRIKVKNGGYLAIVSSPTDIGNRHETIELLCKEIS